MDINIIIDGIQITSNINLTNLGSMFDINIAKFISGLAVIYISIRQNDKKNDKKGS